MTEELFALWHDFIQAKIETAIEQAFGRECQSEYAREIDCRIALRRAYGLPDYKPKK